MRRVIAPVAGLLAALLLASCGIGPTRVIDDRAVPNEAANRSGGGSVPLERSKVNIVDAKELVEFYLRGAAADVTHRGDILTSYLAGSTVGLTKFDTPPFVVRYLSDTVSTEPDGSELVRYKVQHLGVLGDDGLISSGRGQQEYTFRVVKGANGIVFSQVPAELLLSEEALLGYFSPRSLYFWNGRSLMQDLRWIPQSLSPEQQDTKLVTMLLAGPSPWLRDSAQATPESAKLKGVVVRDKGTVTVDLTSPVPEEARAPLAIQLAKTLQVSPSAMRLTASGTDLPVRPTANLDGQASAPPRRYAIVNNSVYRLKNSPEMGTKFLAQQPDLNKSVTAAAVSANETAIALVRSEATGQRLIVLTRPYASPMTISGLPAGPISQPMWLDEGQTMLVQVGEELYQVSVAAGTAGRVAQVKGLTQVSVAPDGRRLAMVIDGALYLVARNDQGTLALDVKQPVFTGFSRVQSAAFHETTFLRNRLIAVGDCGAGSTCKPECAGATCIATFSFDGTDRFEYARQLGVEVKYLVARAGQAFYEVPGAAYEATQTAGGKELGSEIDWAGPALAQFSVKAPSFEG